VEALDLEEEKEDDVGKKQDEKSVAEMSEIGPTNVADMATLKLAPLDGGPLV